MAIRAFITGVTGQDGSLLAKRLCEYKNDDGKYRYDVYGFIRKTSRPNLEHLEPLLASGRLKLLKGDILDHYSVMEAVGDVLPQQIYHLADQDDIRWSTVLPSYQLDVGIKGTLNVLEAARTHGDSTLRIFIPVSATIFNSPAPQCIDTATVWPTSLYGIAKASVLHLARHYRQRYGMWVSIGAMFNHVYLDRSTDYLAPKLAKAAVDLKLGRITSISLYDLQARVDVGWAPEFVEAMRLMLEHNSHLELSIGTGVSAPIRTLWVHALGVVYPEIWGMSGFEQYEFADKFIAPIPQPTGPTPNYWCADTTKAHDVLKWNATLTGPGIVRNLTTYYATKENVLCK